MGSLFNLILIPALLPVALILFYIYRLDKYEREPLGFVLKVVIWGAVFSIPCALVESFLEKIISSLYDPATIQYAWNENILGVALVEEMAKWLVLMKFVWKNKNFDYRFDGIVYSVASSLGFAALENILYIMSYGTDISLGRAIFSIPGHAAFGVFMGYYFCRSKDYSLRGNKKLSVITMILAIAAPVLIHGTYDFLLSEQAIEAGYNPYFFGFVLILDVLSFIVIKREFKADTMIGGRFRGSFTENFTENPPEDKKNS